MISISLKEIAECCNGKLVGDNISVASVTTDSRSASDNELFFALKGERFDAHDFLDGAVKNGARALVVDREVETSVPYIIVPDTKKALGMLGSYVKQKLNPVTVGITGTCGKTTVKDLTYSILSLAGETLATKGNFNNDIGVPLTLLRLTESHKYAIIEMGTNHHGEISYTTNLVHPDIALINNVGYAHLEGFGSLAGVFKAKSEIFQALAEDGTAVFNRDSEFYNEFENEQKKYRLCSFSVDNDAATTYASAIELDDLGRARFVLHNPQGNIPVGLKIVGTHNVSNACAAATVAYALGLDLETIKNGLESYEPFQGRLQISNKNNITLIDDTYNASVNAVFAAIETLNSMKAYKVLILGDMGELGDQAEELHKEVGKRVLNSKIDLFLAVGKLTELSVSASGGKGIFFNTKEELKQWLKDNFDNAKISAVLIKGSHSMKMHEVLNYIKDELC
ncbi:MAG: UDP-N-acetylmuramoyl-tripeptide--D-alanyl-D-alanine ligase [Succinivibrionaceae bacterium]|nr:UDP-N-acetylmuramoyl-tripeptide--D-alanyl-D-alanine ligase [Succinivibrionaceae bacterium]